MSSKNRRVFSLVALLLFVSLVCLADSALAGKQGDPPPEFVFRQIFGGSSNR
ncbi:MAG: hypothetical protein WC028_02215 [Candidatus Obscuribacterales bacterium]